MLLPIAAAVLVSGSIQPAPPSSPRSFEQCLPRDDAAQTPDFFSFRAQLQMAVARRDRDAVLAVTDPGIRTSFGPDSGLASFSRDLEDPKGEIWRELASVLALGGRFDNPTTFVAPYTFACGEAFQDVVVIGADVNVRARAARDAPVIRTVDFAILRGTIPGEEWAEVELGAARKGYIAAQYVRMPTDYRAFFSRVGGRWRLSALVAGD